jgi:hypothetical protein
VAGLLTLRPARERLAVALTRLSAPRRGIVASTAPERSFGVWLTWEIVPSHVSSARGSWKRTILRVYAFESKHAAERWIRAPSSAVRSGAAPVPAEYELGLD